MHGVHTEPDMEKLALSEETLRQMKTVCKAVRNGNVNILEALCKSSILRCVLDGFLDERPLSIATRLQCPPSHNTAIAIMKLLLDNGADIDIKDMRNRTPILNAMLNRDSGEIVKLLVERGADVMVKDNDNRGVLHDAVSCCNIDVLRQIIEKGAEVCLQDSNGRTPLHEAARGSNKEVVSLLIANGAKVYVTDNVGRTALYDALRNRSKGIVRFLIKKGAEVCIRDKSGWTPLHEGIATKWQDVNVLKFLFVKGPMVYAEDNDGWTPLHEAARRGNISVVKLLVRKGAAVCAQDNNGWTPLHEAIRVGTKYVPYANIVNLLIDNGAGVCAKDKRGLTPYHIAIMNGWSLHQHDMHILLHMEVNCNFPADQRLSRDEWLFPGQESHGLYVDAFLTRIYGIKEHLLITYICNPLVCSGFNVRHAIEFSSLHRIVQCGCGINRESELDKFLQNEFYWLEMRPQQGLGVLLYLMSAGIFPQLDTFTYAIQRFRQRSTNVIEIRKYDALIAECVDKLTEVRSLKILCRDKVRKTLYEVSQGKEILSIIHGMSDVPQSIISFLSLDGIDYTQYQIEDYRLFPRIINS